MSGLPGDADATPDSGDAVPAASKGTQAAPEATGSSKNVSGGSLISDEVRKAIAGWNPAANLVREIGTSLLPDLRQISAALAPQIAQVQAAFTPDLVRALQPPHVRLLTRDTEQFLRNIRIEVPRFDFGNILTPDFKATLANIAESLRRVIPDNLRDIRLREWERLLEISEEQRIGVVWIPRTDILRELLDTTTPGDRAAILTAQEAAIVEDCRASLVSTSHPDLTELVEFLNAAINTHLDGHTEAAQALATNVLDTALEQHHVRGVAGWLADFKAAKREDPDEMTLLEMRLRMATAGIPQSYRRYDYAKRDPAFSRNGTAHAVNSALYTPANSLRAITLGTSWLRWLHETWTDAADRAEAASA